jgi:hypothetical protein
VVLCGVLTRQSTAQAIIRLRHVAMDSSGIWSFEIRTEQKSCHFANPPPTVERVSYLVVEAGVSENGLQAGAIRAFDREWRRVSLHRSFDTDASGGFSAPVVISQVQNYDSRTAFVSTRHHLVSVTPSSIAAYQAFFVQVQGEGVWCPDMHYYAEYFDNLDLAGSPVAVVCEPATPDVHWHSCCDGVPSAMAARGSTLFSVRWTSRIRTDEKGMNLFFASTTSSGSRIILDGATVLDKWEDCCSTFTSELITIGEGYHILAYEYRSAANLETTPTNSYAILALSTEGDKTSFGVANHTDELWNAVQFFTDTDPLYADIGWLTCETGASNMHGDLLQADFAHTSSDLTTAVYFGDGFDTVPIVFAGLLSIGSLPGHVRLVEASNLKISIATEYDTCNFVLDSDERMLSWVAIATSTGAWNSAVLQLSTNISDTAALLRIRELLSLPGDLQWHNGTDPCRDRWAGIECRTFGTEPPRVVVLDVRLITHPYSSAV